MKPKAGVYRISPMWDAPGKRRAVYDPLRFFDDADDGWRIDLPGRKSLSGY